MVKFNEELLMEIKNNEDLYGKKDFYGRNFSDELKNYAEDTMMNPGQKSIKIKSFVSLEDALEEIVENYLGNKTIDFNNMYDAIVDNNIYMYELTDYSNMICVIFA